MHNNQYDTLAEALEDLAERGYVEDFHVNSKGMLDGGAGQTFSPSQTELHEFHRFEGMTNPSDASIVYALRTNKGLKGTVVDAYGAEGSERISEFMNSLRERFEI
ncbi:MAG: phosphoribosylpyrophosphate synthetase [Flavobacteriales bacterium]|nr:phosphoribosylpyrophosphate synthetase [Flavobacteriales bacterium]